MKITRLNHLVAVAILISIFLGARIGWADEPSEGEKLFALKVKSLFVQKCNACHGDDRDEIAGGFNMLSRESLLKGGDSFGTEVVVVGGKGEQSFLYRVTTRTEEGFEMPPKESEHLTEEQTWWIRDWIKAGAPWPNDKRIAEIRAEYAEGETVATSGGLGDDWTNRRYKSEHLWAYRPLKVRKPPGSSGNLTSVNPIDAFVKKKLDDLGIHPAGMASPRNLARRLCFTLTGLQPTPAEMKRFLMLHAKNPRKAIDTLVDHWMATPQYGEHLGRKWLDVARYADSAGFANDYARPNAWRYRDYVVRSFNADKPYNEFVRQQIAGDEIDDNDSENLIATGFLRMGPWEQTSMSVFRLTRQQWLDDVTDSVGQAFLAHPLQCCKCHDHKFDPLPTRDYYSMMAVFTTTQLTDQDADFLKSENKTGFKPAHEWTWAKIQSYKEQEAELKKKIADSRKDEVGEAKVGDNGLSPGDEASQGRLRKNIMRHTWELDKTRPVALAVYTGNSPKPRNINKRMVKPGNPWKAGTIEEDTILKGGDAFTRGEKVVPAPISAAVSLGGMSKPDFPIGKGKRRLALADWIVDESNPLAARVIVNRVWSWHFGRGIAGNPNNFGATGAVPTHPELLDFLADWLVKNDWSIKKLNRLIVTSEAFCRSSRHMRPKQLELKDPKREYYAAFIPRRLTAEEVRDVMLQASGELNRQVGGVPCRPDINLEVAMQPRQIMGGTASVYEPDALPKLRNRRTIYAEKLRGLRDPFLETFNQPGPDKSCELRETSTVAPQALTLFNSEEVQDRALAFANRLIRQEKSAQETIKLAFQIAFGRLPTGTELESCLNHWASAEKEEAEKKYTPKKYDSQTKRTVMAEKTGEPYEFVEVMPAYKNYQPDLQPHEVDARTRGLAHVCLVIFNLNEFIYLD